METGVVLGRGGRGNGGDRGSYMLWGAAGCQALILLPPEARFVLEPTPEAAGLVPGTSLFCGTLCIQPAGEQLPCSGHLGADPVGFHHVLVSTDILA